MNKIFLILLFFMPLSLMAEQSCSNLAMAPGFYQETEWYWFKGEAVDLDLDRAYTKASGMAVEKLFDKCEGVHKNARIFHKCHRRIGAAFEVFVIASIYRQDCNEIKFAKEDEATKITNVKITKPMHEFFELVDNNKPKELPCTPEKRENCLKKGIYLFDTAKFLQSLVPLEYACEDGKIKACLLGGISSYILKEENAALTLFRKSCRMGDSDGCLFLGVSLTRFQKYNLARKKFLKSCHLGNARGCLFLGEWHENQDMINKGLKSYYNSCLMDYRDGCRKAYELLKAKAWEMENPFSHKACLLGDSEVCLHRGLKELSGNNAQLGLKFLNKSCELGLGDGCFNMALFLSGEFKDKSIPFFEKGCELGNVSSCLELEQYFVGKKEEVQYQMYSCQLGIEESCLKWGYYLFQKKKVSLGKNILRKSCERGNTKACTFLKSL